MFIDAIKDFTGSVDPSKTRLSHLPKIILIFGSGPVGVEEIHRNSSFRNVFLNWASESLYPLREQFSRPEDFPEWNNFQGYQNLIDFEREVGALSSAILLFSEGYGAIAELGAFCMDPVLLDRLVVVISRNLHGEKSFIVNGPLLKLRGESPGSVCVIDSERPEQFYDEAAVVADVLTSKVQAHPKKTSFAPDQTRDKLLLFADLVELFGALTETEVQLLFDFMGVLTDRRIIRQMASLLTLFRLISEVEKYAQVYYIAPSKNRQSFMDYDSFKDKKNFVRIKFKLEILEILKKDPKRKLAYQMIHGSQALV